MVYIYKIYCKDKDIKDCYIGSTNNIKNRILNHKSICNNENSKNYNNYKYIYIRENGGFANWTYEIMCECPKEDRYKTERYYVENTKNTNLNKQIPNRGSKEYDKEYRELNRDKIKEQKKEYYESNKDKIKDIKNKKYNCECGGLYTYGDKARHLKTKKHELFISSKEVVVKT